MKSSSGIAAIRRWPTDRARRWVENFLATEVIASEILAVVAMGSSVRPSVPSGDVDLLVVTAGHPRPLKAPIEIDVRQYHAAELEDKLICGHDLVGWAVLYGVPIFEKAAFWTAFADKYRGCVPLPSAQLARERGAKAQRHLESLLDVGDEQAAAEQLTSYLTHLARAKLIDHGVYPISRPELASQLRDVGEDALASALDLALSGSRSTAEVYGSLHSMIG